MSRRMKKAQDATFTFTMGANDIDIEYEIVVSAEGYNPDTFSFTYNGTDMEHHFSLEKETSGIDTVYEEREAEVEIFGYDGVKVFRGCRKNANLKKGLYVVKYPSGLS